MLNKTLLPLTLVLVSLLAGNGFAQEDSEDHSDKPVIGQRYVSDVLYLPLRGGKGNQFRIIRSGMKSGTELSLLEEDAEEGWSLVKNSRGETGWVRSQFLVSEPTASLKLAELQATFAKLNSGSKDLLTEIDNLKAKNRSLKNQLTQTKGERDSLAKDFKDLKNVSTNAVALNEQHQKLQTSYQLLQTQSDTYKTENSRLKSEKNTDQWLTGAMIMILGIICTLALQAMGKRKSRSEWAN